jgi:hypothetical protein
VVPPSLALAGVFCSLFVGNVGAYPRAKGTLVDWYARSFSDGNEAWRFIVEAAKGKQLRIAMNDCGKMPYLTGIDTVDLAGLNNREIARGRSSKATVREIERKQPSLVILVGTDKRRLDALAGWERISSSDLLAIGYDYIGVIDTGAKTLDRRDYRPINQLSCRSRA